MNLAKWARHFFFYGNKGAHMWHGGIERKEKGGGRTRITSRDRWCTLADSGNPFHAPDESSVRGGMCALPVYDRCGRTGVRPVSFS